MKTVVKTKWALVRKDLIMYDTEIEAANSMHFSFDFIAAKIEHEELACPDLKNL